MADSASGKAKGGIARAASLSPERRSEIAREAAQKRWAAPREPSPPRPSMKQRKDRLNVELLAVAIFESACRASAARATNELTMIHIWTKTPAWADLTKENRDGWRQKAREMIAEQS